LPGAADHRPVRRGADVAGRQTASVEIRFDEASNRWELRDGERLIGLADRVDRGGVVVLPHVEVDPSLRGRGLAAKLVTHALDEVRAEGKSVDPQCPYVAAFIRRHPDYADLVAS